MMKRILTVKGALIFAAIAFALALLTVSLVLAQNIVTRGQPAFVSVTGQVIGIDGGLAV